MIPNISKKGLFWEGHIQFIEWEKYFGFNLNLQINIGGDCIVDKLTNLHERGYKYLMEEQSRVLQSIIRSMYTKYPTWQNEYGYEGQEKEQLMPDIINEEDVKQLILPKKIYILDIAKDNLPYIGIEFQCKWDEEHGIGIMLHKERIIRIGGAEMAFLSWVAVEDKERLGKLN